MNKSKPQAPQITDAQLDWLRSKQQWKPDAAASAFQREFDAFIDPQDVALIFKQIVRRDETAQSVDQIRAEVGDDAADLLWARELIRRRMERENVSDSTFVELAREFRQNIVSRQEVAQMADKSGKFLFVLNVGEQVKALPRDEKVIDVG